MEVLAVGSEALTGSGNLLVEWSAVILVVVGDYDEREVIRERSYDRLPYGNAPFAWRR